MDPRTPMDAKPVNVAMPDALRDFVDERVRNSEYADAGEYLRDLVRRNREQQAAARLRAVAMRNSA